MSCHICLSPGQVNQAASSPLFYFRWASYTPARQIYSEQRSKYNLCTSHLSFRSYSNCSLSLLSAQMMSLWLWLTQKGTFDWTWGLHTSIHWINLQSTICVNMLWESVPLGFMYIKQQALKMKQIQFNVILWWRQLQDHRYKIETIHCWLKLGTYNRL